MPQLIADYSVGQCAATTPFAVDGIAAGVGALGTGYATLPHLLVVTHMGVRKLPLRLEKYRYGQTCH